MPIKGMSPVKGRDVPQKCLVAMGNYILPLEDWKKLAFFHISLRTGHPGFHPLPRWNSSQTTVLKKALRRIYMSVLIPTIIYQFLTWWLIMTKLFAPAQLCKYQVIQMNLGSLESIQEAHLEQLLGLSCASSKLPTNIHNSMYTC